MVTHQILKDTIEVCDEQCDSDGLALSQAFGNFDRRVAVGWLLADAAGKPLLERPQAHALGLKAQRAHGAAKVSIRDARKRAIAPARAAGADISAAQDDAEAKIWREDAGVIAADQPPAAPAAPAASAAAEGGTGSRKRAREHPSDIEAADYQVLQCETAMDKADRALGRAEDASDAQMQHVLSLFDKLDSSTVKGIKRLRMQSRIRKEGRKSHNASLAAKNAKIAALEAKVGWWEAREARTALGILQSWEEGWDEAVHALESLESQYVFV
jgi:hypothetical protein